MAVGKVEFGGHTYKGLSWSPGASIYFSAKDFYGDRNGLNWSHEKDTNGQPTLKLWSDPKDDMYVLTSIPCSHNTYYQTSLVTDFNHDGGAGTAVQGSSMADGQHIIVVPDFNVSPEVGLLGVRELAVNQGIVFILDMSRNTIPNLDVKTSIVWRMTINNPDNRPDIIVTRHLNGDVSVSLDNCNSSWTTVLKGIPFDEKGGQNVIHILPVKRGIFVGGDHYVPFPEEDDDGAPIWVALDDATNRFDLTGNKIPIVIYSGAKINLTFGGSASFQCQPILYTEFGMIQTKRPVQTNKEFAPVTLPARLETIVHADQINGVSSYDLVSVIWPISTDSSDIHMDSWHYLIETLGNSGAPGETYGSWEGDVYFRPYSPLLYGIEMRILPDEAQEDEQYIWGASSVEQVVVRYSSVESSFSPSQCIFTARNNQLFSSLVAKNQVFRVWVGTEDDDEEYLGRFYVQNTRHSSAGFGETRQEILGFDCLKRLSNTMNIRKLNYDGQPHTNAIEELCEDYAGLVYDTPGVAAEGTWIPVAGDIPMLLPDSLNKQEPFWGFSTGTSVADIIRTIIDVTGGLIFSKELYTGIPDTYPTVYYVNPANAGDMDYKGWFSSDADYSPGMPVSTWGSAPIPIASYEKGTEDTLRSDVIVLTKAHKHRKLEQNKVVTWDSPDFDYVAGDIIGVHVANPAIKSKIKDGGIGERRIALLIAPQYGSADVAFYAAQTIMRQLSYPVHRMKFSVETNNAQVCQVRPGMKIWLAIEEIGWVDRMLVNEASYRISKTGIFADYETQTFPEWRGGRLPG